MNLFSAMFTFGNGKLLIIVALWAFPPDGRWTKIKSQSFTVFNLIVFQVPIGITETFKRFVIIHFSKLKFSLQITYYTTPFSCIYLFRILLLAIELLICYCVKMKILNC